MAPLTYSIVIPAYNEGERLGATLDKVMAFLDQKKWTAEVLVVNDGSTDNTADLVRQHISRAPRLRLLENPGNRGKGYSVRNGMLQASGDILLFTDADLSSPISECEKLFAALSDGAEIAIGSRWARSELQTQRQPLYRQLFGRMFNLLLRMFLGLHFKDTQCGFKAFTRAAAQTVFPLQKIERWGFDPELLYLGQRAGFKMAEVPVEWAHCTGTRLHPFRDGIRMFGDVMKIRWYSWTGKYGSLVSSVPSPMTRRP